MVRYLIPLQILDIMRSLFLIILFSLFLAGASGQTDSIKFLNDSLPGRVYLLQGVTRDGEAMPEIQIKEVTIMGKRPGSAKSWARKYNRLVFNLKVVYPYALIVRERLDEVNKELEKIPGDRERRKYVSNVEKDVFNEYEDDIRELTITQGRLLLKLIDRETSNTSYELIHRYRGGLNAAFWQGVARLFGTNLKEEYDPYGDDIVMELIVQEIEAGHL
jgi:hypothetical protein